MRRRAAAPVLALALFTTLPASALPVPGHPALGKHEETPGPSQPEPPAQGFTRCVDGRAGAYPCSGVDLLSFVPLSQLHPGATPSSSDLWGWTDPATGREVAIVGLSDGTAFVDVSDPRHPVVLGHLPTASIASSWRELKTISHYALIVADRAGEHGLQVFDLEHLRDVDPAAAPVTFHADAVFHGFGTAHNLTVDEETQRGFAVGSDRCAGGLLVLDLHDPLHVSQIGCFADDGYTHDVQCVVYRGPDARFAGREVCLASNEDTLTIVDVDDPARPRLLSRTSYAGVGYTHQGWLTPDHRHFLLDDELDERRFGGRSRTYLWDVADLEQPRLVGVHEGATTAIDHNQFVVGDRVYQADYRAGLRVLDTTGIAEGRLTEIGFFDVFPADDAPEFNGAWGVYPFFPSGVVAVSGIEQGLYLLQPGGADPTPHGCTASALTSCLQAGRFAVEAQWRNPWSGAAGTARTKALDDFAAAFSFEDPANVELVVKVLDFGDHVLVFDGQLTNLPFVLRVTDTTTGEVRQYRNQWRNCGEVDAHAFHDEGSPPPAPVAGRAGTGIPGRRPLPRPRRPRPAAAAAGSCRPDATTLCWGDGRWSVRATWRNPGNGRSGSALAAPLTPLVGGFAFDDPRNPELLAKVLAWDGHLYWLWGALTNLEYELTLTDTATGAVATRSNPAGTYCGGLAVDPFR